MDFYQIKERITKKEHIEVYPEFLVRQNKDIMIRGKSFYAVWDEEHNIWSTNEYDVARLIDADLYEHRKKLVEKNPDVVVSVNSLCNFSGNGWLQYCNFIKHSPDNYHTLDSKLAFANSKLTREDYASKRLPYDLSKGTYDAWDEIVGTLYDPDEREKIEWAIGSIVAGEAKDIQKFLVFYGEAGAGKSTILNIIQELFTGYYAMFEAKALASSNNAFSTEAFKSNPLVAIQHDGDLSRIEDNSKLNSIISHEEMLLNEKYKASYTARINCFLFMATNRPVKITDAKSGIIRRLIDVRPSGRKIPASRYFELMHQVSFELGAIAWRCLEVYKDCGKNYYNSYRPLDMMFKTDVFYNFVEDSFDTFREQNGVTLKQAWDMYKFYCDEALVDHKLPMYRFREELKNYFAEYKDVARVDGKQVRKYYSGFLSGKFVNSEKVETGMKDSWLKFDKDVSIFDQLASDYPAQLANDEEKPVAAWDHVTTKLRDIDTKKVHYVRVPKNHIVIDFDIKDEHKAKSFDLNHEAASKFPPTYAELSKSGAGIHLHYIYEGDPDKLAPIYSTDIEVKVFKGKSSLRRKLSACNDIPIATISSGLPLKGDDSKMIDFKTIQDNDHLVNFIRACLAKKHHGATKPEVDFIYTVLEDVYKSGVTYDVTDMYHDIYQFASNSTHNAEKCIETVMKMKLQSKDHETNTVITRYEFAPSAPRTFYDVEVFKNLFVIVYLVEGGQPIALINPSPSEVYNLIWTSDGKLAHRWVGFNNKRYDNHIIMARSKGEDLMGLYNRSQKIIGKEYGAYVEGAKDISEWDIWDYASNKQGLKRWEIDLDIDHKELEIPWDAEVPESQWDLVVEYCTNDVLATKAVWDATEEDRRAREILAKIAGMSTNTSTNDLTAQIIFGDDMHPQKQFNYRFMGDIPNDIYVLDTETFEYHEEHGLSAQDLIDRGWYSVFDKNMRPVFPGYTFDQYAKVNKSMYRGISVGEGGFVYAEPGMYRYVPVNDITSQHPHSIKAEELFGKKYTDRFYDLLQLRIHIKHKEYDKARSMLGGVVAEYLQDDKNAKILSKVLKIPINSVYGLTSAKFNNRFRDPRNIDNIVAKRGALFMVNLLYEVQKRGFTVAHIKTDSIKVPNATRSIEEFVRKYGKAYGYSFECEEVYDRMCLVNDAVYIAKYKKEDNRNDPEHAGKWTATGAQFAHPYVFKALFTKEPLTFNDLCETRTVQTAMYLDYNENLPEGEHCYTFVGKAGRYCPVLPGCGGGILLREKDGKYYSVSGSKGYRWMEATTVKTAHKENCIDMNYFYALADAAKDNISQYCDFTWFASEDTEDYDFIDIESDQLPF